MNMSEFLSQYGILLLAIPLIIFMVWNSRRRMQKQKADQEERARQTVPGAEVLLQGGIYGTIVEFDPENLDQPAVVEVSPGVEIRVHSQAVLRVVTSTEDEQDSDDDEDQSEDEFVDEVDEAEIDARNADAVDDGDKSDETSDDETDQDDEVDETPESVEEASAQGRAGDSTTA